MNETSPSHDSTSHQGNTARRSLTLEETLGNHIAAGGKCFVPYLTGGLAGWTDAVHAAVGAGANAIEIGVPFSDPVMDGPVIQESSQRALDSGTTPATVLGELEGLDVEVPLAVMTYANLVYRFGWDRFAGALVRAGVSGAILPDIPLEEAGPWCDAADRVGVETVMLAAPTGDDARLERIVERSRGFVYAVGLLGITGERSELAATARTIAGRLKALTNKPVLVGVGVSTPHQAVEVCEVADGVIVGSAIMRRILETGSAEAGGDLIGQFVEALRAG